MSEQMNALAATWQSFALADAHTPLQWDRIVIQDDALAQLRRAIRRVIRGLCSEDQDQDLIVVAAKLQFEMAAWLTSPCQYDAQLSRFLCAVLGTAADAPRRWGGDIAVAFADALHAANALASRGSRLRQEVGGELQRLIAGGRSFRIYCRRVDRAHFQGAAEAAGRGRLADDHFLHSPRQYRDTAQFDVLIRVGPLRQDGISGAPEALLNAPRFSNLVQFVWEEIADDPDFGVDLIESMLPDAAQRRPSEDGPWESCGFHWQVETLQIPDELGVVARKESDGQTWVDDLEIPPKLRTAEPLNRAVLLHLAQRRGVLYPSKAIVLGLQATSGRIEATWMSSEELEAGMYLVVPDLEEYDADALTADPGRHSRTWKRLLGEELQRNREHFIRRLRGAGIDLVNIAGAVDNWVKLPSTVIHAPQTEHHFMVLMKALAESDPGWKEWLWRAAWSEVRRSRGEAIVAGVLEQEKVRDGVLLALKSISSAVAERAEAASDFEFTCPRGFGLSGTLRFMRLLDVEEGFRVPEREVRVIRQQETFNRWLF